MARSITNNYYVEKLDFLPDNIYISVARQWYFSVITMLGLKCGHSDFMDILNNGIEAVKKTNKCSVYVPGYISISVGEVKKLIDICGDGNFYCVFPCNYEELADVFLASKLGITKDLIYSLMDNDKIEAVFDLIDTIDDDYLRRLSLLYMKTIYNKNAEEMVMSFKNSRRKTANRINQRLYY